MAYSIELKPHSFKKKTFSIDEQSVSFGDKSLATAEVTGLAYGKVQHRSSGVKTHANYTVKFQDKNGKELSVDFLGGAMGTTKGADEAYDAIINEAWNEVGYRLFTSLHKALVAGTPFPVGKCTLLPEGIQFTRKPLFGSKKEYLVKWHDLNITLNDGLMQVKSRTDKKAQKTLSPDKDYNACVLYSYYKRTTEDGSLLGEVYRTHGLSAK